MRSKAFTLIELLIVVAIIAILAAIALPNFLEAQTRSKVSRLKSDMRTAGVAIQAYAVDWNGKPPIPNAKGSPWADRTRPYNAIYQTAWGGSGSASHLKCPPNIYNGGMGSMLTTPVAYLGSIPTDPFNTRVYNIATSVDAWGNNYYNSAPANPFRIVNWGLEVGKPLIYAYWWLQSYGPGLGGNNTVTFYDPSNGTLIPGSIWYFDSVGFLAGGR